jgi:hypothetical protein
VDIRKETWGYDPRYVRCEPFVGDESMNRVYFEVRPTPAGDEPEPRVGVGLFAVIVAAIAGAAATLWTLA